jgi:hypothetical protein
MMSYAGIDLPLVPPKLAQWVNANIPPADLFDTHYSQDALGCIPVPQPYDPPPISPGVLTWPTGASRWATFYTLITRQQFEALRLALIPDPVANKAGYPAAPLILDDGITALTVQMTMLPPRPLSGWSPEPTEIDTTWDPVDCNGDCTSVCGDPESPTCLDCMRNCPGNPAGDDEIFGEANDLYLLTLVDARYFWWSKRVADLNEVTWAALFEELLPAVETQQRPDPCGPRCRRGSYRPPVHPQDVRRRVGGPAMAGGPVAVPGPLRQAVRRRLAERGPRCRSGFRRRPLRPGSRWGDPDQ